MIPSVEIKILILLLLLLLLLLICLRGSRVRRKAFRDFNNIDIQEGAIM